MRIFWASSQAWSCCHKQSSSPSCLSCSPSLYNSWAQHTFPVRLHFIYLRLHFRFKQDHPSLPPSFHPWNDLQTTSHHYLYDFPSQETCPWQIFHTWLLTVNYRFWHHLWHFKCTHNAHTRPIEPSVSLPHSCIHAMHTLHLSQLHNCKSSNQSDSTSSTYQPVNFDQLWWLHCCQRNFNKQLVVL